VRDDQVRRITLNPVAGADLDALFVGSAYQREDIEKDSIFSILRVGTKLNVI
jgi:hypothetical protein